MIEYGGTTRFMERFSNLNNAEDCNRLCQGIPFCEAWTHHEASNDCSLHTKDESLSNRGQQKAGVLECRAGFVGCFRSYPYRRPWNNIFMGYVGWSRQYIMHSEIACIESCRGMDTALYAIYTRHREQMAVSVRLCKRPAFELIWGQKGLRESMCK